MGSALDPLVAWVISTVLMSHFVGIVSCFVISGGPYSPPSTCLPPRGGRQHYLSRLTSRTGSHMPMKKNHHRLGAKKGKGSSAGRPTLDDVERLSRGQAAKKRGTGSRAVCHRLNESERKAFDVAKKQGYVVLRGTGYRRERKGSPLLNIFRQFCDAKAVACISVCTGLGPDATDEVEIDFSTLRAPQETTDVLGERADEIAAGLEALREKEGAAGGEGDIASDSSGGIGSGLSMAEGEGVQGGGMGSEEENGEEEEEEEEEEWVGNPSKMPIWKFPVVSRVYRCATRKGAKDVAEALSSVR